MITNGALERRRGLLGWEKLEAFAFERTWLSAVVARLERRMKLSLARSEGEIYLTLGTHTSQTVLERPLT